MAEPEQVEEIGAAVERVLARCGPNIVAATPLGLGKPNRLLNALYRRVAGDADLSLTLYTALSLARPRAKSGLGERFLAPFVERHFGGDYPDLAYVTDLGAGRLPANVRVHEFYLQSGALLGSEQAQRDYTSLNYTHVARDVAARNINLFLQLLARRGERLSLSSNADVTLDLLERMEREGRARPYVVGVIHPDLPFLSHDAEIPRATVDLLLEEPGPAHRLFAVPREPVTEAEAAVGLHASALVRDGGTLQVGIGALSDALVQALLLRHRDNATYRDALAAVRGGAPPDVVQQWGGEEAFARGLYGASEMVMDGFMHLRRAGILRRRVFDHLGLQRLLNAGRVSEIAGDDTLERLVEAGIVPASLDRPSVDWLADIGWLPAGTTLTGGQVVLPDGARIDADLLDDDSRAALGARIAGRELRGGRYLHGAFFLGSQPFLDWLRNLDGADFEGLCMTRVSVVNELYGGRETLDVAQRHQARFFNTCMMHTLLGAAVSDGLADGLVVSGVGGQYNFVAMAHALPDGRSILLLRSTRASHQHVRSSVLWSYAHETIPRHLRDIVVTEHGVADLRGASDEDVVKRMLAITDSRFQEPLAEQARRAGKLSRSWRIPQAWRTNTPERLRDALKPYRARGLFPTFPFGSDFTREEERLLRALKRVEDVTRTRLSLLSAVARALAGGTASSRDAPLLARLGLDQPRRAGDRVSALLVSQALRDTEPDVNA